jgi:hypothetical protein
VATTVLNNSLVRSLKHIYDTGYPRGKISGGKIKKGIPVVKTKRFSPNLCLREDIIRRSNVSVEVESYRIGAN